MPRDYAKRGSSSSAKRSGSKRRAASPSRRPRGASRQAPKAGATVPFSAPSFAAGLVFGALLMLALPFLEELLQAPLEARAQPEETPEPVVVFDFEDRLRTGEVRVDADAYDVEFEELDPEDPTPYFLQAASFRSFAQAADLQATLAAQDLPATVSRVNVGDRPWYRVTVGPFARRKDAQRAMTRLREHNLAPQPMTRG